ncbi:MAG: CRISPR-associated endonuclease Cas1 [Phycisphaerae bacterium]|nr:MAG: CRISPR-associated endonuclease Cas1 [Phycisphaerae bacterium]
MPGDSGPQAHPSGPDRRTDPWGAGDRVLDFSLGQAHLALRYEQLVISRDGFPDVTTPINEVAVAVLASQRVTCTLPVLDALMSAGAAVVVCNDAMHPSGLMLPLAGHFQQTRRMIAQATAKLPVKKQLWRQIVVAKVQAQGSLLRLRNGDDGGMVALARRVRSGDPENIEAQAAQRYWPLLFNDAGFLRRRFAPDQNRLLNYGYAVLRAAVGRALVASGLHPSLGVHHTGRENAFCLADDLMEPYRPVIDGVVVEVVGETGEDTPLDPRTKERLVNALHERLAHEGEARTVFEWIARSAASLARILGDRRTERLFFPRGLVEP